MSDLNTEVHTRKRLLLFMSVDLAGSTAFKSKSVHGAVQPWLPVFVKFFREFPATLRRLYVEFNNPEEFQPTTPRLWKAIGDELVFVTEIKHHGEIPVHLGFFRDTVRSYRDSLHKTEKKLDLKATAWVAGVPVFNSVILLPSDYADSLVEDYIGPSIDVGFRLAKLATPRRLVISVELAYLLCRMQGHRIKGFEFYYEGGAELKGVLDGYPYPVIWTDLHLEAPLEKAEALLRPTTEPTNRDRLGDYVELLINTLKAPLFIPFIENDTSFGNNGGDLYEADYKDIGRTWRDLYVKQLAKSQTGTTVPDTPFDIFKTQTDHALQGLGIDTEAKIKRGKAKDGKVGKVDDAPKFPVRPNRPTGKRRKKE